MIDLQIRIPINLFGLNLWKAIKRQVPQQWNDLTGKQLVRICRYLYSDMKDADLKLILITSALLRVPRWILFVMAPVQVVQLQWYVDFIFKDNTLTRQLLPTIRIGTKKYYGPPDQLKYVKAKEFIQIEKHFRKYHKTKETEHLDKMIACMYRPAGRLSSNRPKHKSFCGDIREDFNGNTVEQRAGMISRLRPEVKMAIYTWFVGCMEFWRKIFKRVHDTKGKKKREHFGWPETLLNMAGEKFGTIDRTKEHYIFDILLEMEIELKQAEEMKEKFGK